MSTIISKLEEIKSFVKDDEDYYISKENAEKMNTNAQTFLEKLGVIKNYINNLEIHDEEEEDDVIPVKKQSILSKLGNLIPSIYTKSKSESESEIKYDDMEEARKKEEKEESDKKKRSERQQKREATDSEFVSLGKMFNTEEDDQEREEAERAEKEARERKAAEEKRLKQEREEEQEQEREEEQEQERKAAEFKEKLKQAEEKKKQKYNELLAQANKIASGFESEFSSFKINITEAKNTESVEESLSKAEEYFKKKKARLNEISKNISDTSKKAPIAKIQSNLESAYNGFKTLATDRIEELKIEEEKQKMWNADDLNKNFKNVWAEFKKLYEEKIPPELMMNEDSNGFIQQVKKLMIFFSTCDDHLQSIITNIHPELTTGRAPPFEKTLRVLYKIKYIFGYSKPAEAHMRGSDAGTQHSMENGNAFTTKFFEFMKKINNVSDNGKNIVLRVNLSRTIDIVRYQDILLKNLTTWLGKIYKEYKKIRKGKEPVDVLTTLATNIKNNIPHAKKVITIKQEDMLKQFIYEFISDDVLNLMNQKFFLTLSTTIPKLDDKTPLDFVNIFTISQITPTDKMAILNECKPSTTTSIKLGGNKTKKLKYKQMFRKTHKKISTHKNGAAHRFYRGQHRSRKNNHIHQITVRKH